MIKTNLYHNNQKKIKAAVIGLGVGAHHARILSSHPSVNLKWLCDFNKKKLFKIFSSSSAERFTLNPDDIFKDPEVNLVCIASYDEYHFEQIIKALDNNKNIYVEKPICLSFDELTKIKKKLAKKPDLRISSNMVLRTCPLFNKVKNSIKLKKMGKIYHIDSDYLWGRKKKLISGWRTNTDKYSIIYGAAIHIVDLIFWLIKKKPIRVQAVGNQITTLGTKQKNNDFAMLILEFDDRLIVKISAHGGCVHSHFHTLKVFGTNSSFIHDRMGTVWMNFNKTNIKLKKEKAEYPAKSKRDAALNSFLEHLVDGKKKPMISQKDIFDVMSICLAGEKSIKKGKKINIKYV